MKRRASIPLRLLLFFAGSWIAWEAVADSPPPDFLAATIAKSTTWEPPLPTDRAVDIYDPIDYPNFDGTFTAATKAITFGSLVDESFHWAYQINYTDYGAPRSSQMIIAAQSEDKSEEVLIAIREIGELIFPEQPRGDITDYQRAMHGLNVGSEGSRSRAYYAKRNVFHDLCWGTLTITQFRAAGIIGSAELTPAPTAAAVGSAPYHYVFPQIKVSFNIKPTWNAHRAALWAQQESFEAVKFFVRYNKGADPASLRGSNLRILDEKGVEYHASFDSIRNESGLVQIATYLLTIPEGMKTQGMTVYMNPDEVYLPGTYSKQLFFNTYKDERLRDFVYIGRDGGGSTGGGGGSETGADKGFLALSIAEPSNRALVKSAEQLLRGVIQASDPVKSLSYVIYNGTTNKRGLQKIVAARSDETNAITPVTVYEKAWSFPVELNHRMVSYRFADELRNARKLIIEVTAIDVKGRLASDSVELLQDKMSFENALSGGTADNPPIPYGALGYHVDGGIDKYNKLTAPGISCSGFITLVLQRMIFGEAWLHKSKPELNFYKNTVGNDFGSDNAEEFRLGRPAYRRHVSQSYVRDGRLELEIQALIAAGTIKADALYMFSLEQGRSNGHVAFVRFDSDGTGWQSNYTKRANPGGLDRGKFSTWLENTIGGGAYPKPALWLFEVPELRDPD